MENIWRATEKSFTLEKPYIDISVIIPIEKYVELTKNCILGPIRSVPGVNP